MARTITINYKPRSWSDKIHNTDKRWIVVVAHRRAGKTTMALNHLQRDFITQTCLPNPPKEEQMEIANYLDEKTLKIDTIVSKIKDQIKTLKEFRKTLINDVVTGKVRVQDE